MAVEQALLALVGAADTGAYQINQSLRFNPADSARLYRTLAASQTRTYSFWYKYANLSGGNMYLFHHKNSGDTNYLGVRSGGSPSENQWQTLNQGSSFTEINSSRKYRDPSAWQHVLWKCTSTNVTMYVNGVEFASTGGANTSLSGGTLEIGARGSAEYFGGYIAEFHFVDGTAYNPSDFGETDTITGAWIPKRFSGTYGSNGAYLKFDPSATNGIGHDHSGNGNNFTATGFSTSSSTYNIGNDVVFDTPTNNHATWLPGKSDAFMPGQAQAYPDYRQNGNLYGNTGRNSPNSIFSSIPFPDNAKTYVEVYINDVGGGGGSHSPGVSIGCDLNGYGPYLYGSGNYNQDTAASYSGYDGAFTWNGGSGTSNGGVYGASTLIGIAVDTTTGSPTISFYKNGTLVGTGTVGSNYRKSLVVRIDPVTGSSTAVGAYINAGQYVFNNLPTGYKALNTANLPEPTIKKGSKYFDTKLYTGTDASLTVNYDFSPDFVWIKSRSHASDNSLYDIVRGTNLQLRSNSTIAELNDTNGFNSFNSNGFTLGVDTGDNINAASRTYVAWAWDANGAGSSNTAGSITSTVSANASAGFSIVTYTGNNVSGATVGHGLGVAPKMIIIKNRSSIESWPVYHAANTSAPETDYLVLNTTAATADATTPWNDTLPSSTVFTLGNWNALNENGSNHVAYCFSEVAGYSKFGSYTGNGSTDGVFVYCGFSPRWIMWKETTVGESWFIHDTARTPYNVSTQMLRPNYALQESTGDSVDILSNGFKFRSGGAGANFSGRVYIFAAFAEHPFKYSNAR